MQAASAAGLLTMTGCATLAGRSDADADWLKAWERLRTIRNAARWLHTDVRTITTFPAPRSPGDKHAYYSEGDYWWADPENPGGPYIRRDGFSNPDKFDAHRQALIRLSLIVPSLTAAWHISGKRYYAEAAMRHLDGWFVTPESRMAPHLDHAQAIIGINTGRGIGIIDTLHLVEVARAAMMLEAQWPSRIAPVKDWFANYIEWLRTSKNGLDERDELNNHGSCYVLQLATFGQFADDDDAVKWARRQFKEVLIPNQIASDGRQPLELARTKPYGYCLFNMDVLATSANILSTSEECLWTFKSANDGSLIKALDFMAPFIAQKSTWPFAQDVEYWDQWPVRHPSLYFGHVALKRERLLELWRGLDPDPSVAEIVRNYPVRNPVLW